VQSGASRPKRDLAGPWVIAADEASAKRLVCIVRAALLLEVSPAVVVQVEIGFCPESRRPVGDFDGDVFLQLLRLPARKMTDELPGVSGQLRDAAHANGEMAERPRVA